MAFKGAFGRLWGESVGVEEEAFVIIAMGSMNPRLLSTYCARHCTYFFCVFSRLMEAGSIVPLIQMGKEAAGGPVLGKVPSERAN